MTSYTVRGWRMWAALLTATGVSALAIRAHDGDAWGALVQVASIVALLWIVLVGCAVIFGERNGQNSQ